MNVSKTCFSLSLVFALALTGLVNTASADTVNWKILQTNPDHIGVEKTGHLSAPVASVLPSEASHQVTESEPTRLGVPAPSAVKVGNNPIWKVDNVTSETDPLVFGEGYTHNHL